MGKSNRISVIRLALRWAELWECSFDVSFGDEGIKIQVLLVSVI